MICEKCGFEYTSEKCPVCAANEANAQVEQKNEKSPCGLIGMIMGMYSKLLYYGNSPCYCRTYPFHHR